MFSEVRSRIADAADADSPWRSRLGKLAGGRGGPAVTEADVHELEATARALRRQLHQIVDDELASNNEACDVATNGMVLLRNERDEKRARREELRGILEGARNELERMEQRCTHETELKETCKEDVARMKDDTERAREENTNVRAEMEQLKYFQESVDMETMHRLRADVENLKIEKERDEIALRNITHERDELRSELERLKALRDAHEIVAMEQRREISEAKMTREMYRAHQEALTMHLQSLGGGKRNSLNSLTANFGESLWSLIPVPYISRKIKDENEGDASENTSRKEDSPQEDMQHHTDQPRPDKARSEKSNPSAVGAIVFGVDTATGGEGSADFLRKLPTIFKLGGEGDGRTFRRNSTSKDREVEFSADSNSISAISAITLDEDQWTEIVSDEGS